MSKDKQIVRGRGGGGGGEAYTPVEAPNNLKSTSTARIVDVLCEGLIYGPANGGVGDGDGLKWKKSTYFNEVPVVGESGTINFTGVTLDGRCGYSMGTSDSLNKAYPLTDFDSIDNVTVVNTQIKKETGEYTLVITDPDVDTVYITLEFPVMLQQEDNGDTNPTTVKYHVDVIGDDGAGDVMHWITAAGEGTLTGKNVSPFRRQHQLDGLNTTAYLWGTGPYHIKIYRDTDDTDTVKKQNAMYLYSYTESKSVKMSYPDTAVAGVSLISDKFGGSVPARAYNIYGRYMWIPSNYTPDIENGGGTYSGVWDGEFKYGYCSNPAWVLFDMINNERFGLGEDVDPALVDKWKLYTIGQYCDEPVDFIERTRLPGGGYSSDSTSSEPRFTFNGVISDRRQALAVINHLCSVFRGYPIWTSGFVSFDQDTPKDITRIANQSNVKDGLFEYEGTAKSSRTTAVNVSYNDMDQFGKPTIVTIHDEDGIIRYGYNPIDIFCFGCTSKNEAIRRAKYILYTDLNQTELVSFTGGIEWADGIPGEVIGIQDKDYVSSVNQSGRVVSGTTTSITIDRPMEIEVGETYTLYCADNTAATVFEKILTNDATTTTTLTWSGAVAEAPSPGQTWAVTKSSVTDVRQFQITNVKELTMGSEYEVSAILYDPNKYTFVEDGNIIEVPPASNLPIGALDPPSNLQVQPFTYTDGDKKNRKYGALISWVASPDSRTQDYQIQIQKTSEAAFTLDRTASLSYTWRDVPAGTYSIKVRATSATGNSEWILYPDFTMVTNVKDLAAPTNLRTIDEPATDEFNGPDCEIEWDASVGAAYDGSTVVYISDGTDTNILELDTTSSVGYDTVFGYKIEVYKVDNTLLRTWVTEDGETLQYIYTFNMNNDDNAGSPIRQIKFKVYAFNKNGTLSPPATLTASNPQPTMVGQTPTVYSKPTYLDVTWSHVLDNDLSFYRVYYDSTSTLTYTQYIDVPYPITEAEVFGLNFGTTYYIEIVPYDLFGIGISSQQGTGTPTQIIYENVDLELSQSIIITDSLDTTSEQIIELYDGILDSGGVVYPDTVDSWIKYDMAIENFINGVQVWSDSAVQCWFELEKADGTKTYYGGNGSHALVSSEGQDRLTQYASLALAKTNYWQKTTSGYEHAFLPNGVVAKYCTIYMTAPSDYQIYELVFRRIVIAEDIATENLSAISADIGVITAGSIQSPDYSATEGMIIDLDNKDINIRKSSVDILTYDGDTGDLSIRGVITALSSSDLPWSSVSGEAKPEDYATDNNSWEHPSDQTKIDGGQVYIGSTLKLAEGGIAEFGNKNVIIDTAGNHGSIIVAVDGGPEAGDYCVLSDGDLDFYIKVGEEHFPYKSLTRVEGGTAANGTWTTIPGYFKNAPRVIVTPASLRTYDNRYPTQSQSLKMEATQVQETSLGSKQWKFYTQATLELSEGSTGGLPINDTESRSVYALSSWATLTQSPTVSLVGTTRSITVNFQTDGYTRKLIRASRTTTDKAGHTTYYPGLTYFYRAAYVIRLWVYLVGSGWAYIDKYINPGRGSSPAPQSFSMTYSHPTYNLSQFYSQWIYSGLNSYSTINTAQSTYTRELLTCVSYSSDQISTSILETGNLNWLAIGS